MTTILSYLRLLLFLAGVLIGIQVPGFVDQYGKSLESHYLESGKNLREFQEDADKYFEGDIEELIAHYKKDKDPVFTSGGESIDSIYQRNINLKKALANFKQGSFSAYTQVFLSPVKDIRSEVWRAYTYTIKLDPSAIVVGLTSGLILAIVAEFAVRGLIALMVLLNRKLQGSH